MSRFLKNIYTKKKISLRKKRRRKKKTRMMGGSHGNSESKKIKTKDSMPPPSFTRDRTRQHVGPGKMTPIKGISKSRQEKDRKKSKEKSEFTKTSFKTGDEPDDPFT